jgi:hypothetical protein
MTSVLNGVIYLDLNKGPWQPAVNTCGSCFGVGRFGLIRGPVQVSVTGCYEPSDCSNKQGILGYLSQCHVFRTLPLKLLQVVIQSGFQNM